jgi:hypothetical protein
MIPPEMPDGKAFTADSDTRRDAESDLGRVQCPNCCKLAYVVRRSMGLLFYRCELCETVGATPETSVTTNE